mgnify:CR=1 FL=1|tara:strand:- start:2118 stop:2537 length:420 start_codon:yes stop_codon:yes gene_type:complete
MIWLKTVFPESIGIGAPLKVGIFDEIRTFEAADKPALIWLRRALYFHTSRANYLKNIVVGASRVDLKGATAGEVLESESKNGKERLNKIKEKQERIKKKSTLTKQQKGKAEAIKKEEPLSATTGRKTLTLKKKQTALES